MRDPLPPSSRPRRPSRTRPLPTTPVVVEIDPVLNIDPPPRDDRISEAPVSKPAAAPRKRSGSRLPPPPRPALRRKATAALLLLVLSLGALPLLAGLTQQASDNPREIQALAIADETWRSPPSPDADGAILERLVPVLDGRPILDQPPGLAWLTVFAYRPLDLATTNPSAQRFRARLLSVAMSLLTLTAVFWAGQSLGGLRTAVFASLVVLANPLLVIHGRLATPEAATTGLAMLSVAAALWAIRPRRPAPKVLRQAAGWGLCGIALGLATLTRGPAIVPQVVLPLLLIGLICPRRISHLMGLAAAGAAAALMTVPWAIYVHQQDPHVWSGWFELLRPPTDPRVLVEAIAVRSVALIVGSGLWSILVVAALIAPWVTQHRQARRAMLVGWVWAVSVIGLVLLGPVFGETGWSTMVAEVLLAVPVLAVAAAQLLQRIGDVARQGGLSRVWAKTALPTAALVLAVSLVGPLVLAQRSSGLAVMHTAYWLGTGAVLLLLGVLATRWALRPFPGRAVACWSAWTVVATTLVMIPASQGPLRLPQAQQKIDSAGEVEARTTVGPVAPEA